jgi:hypothetical protein
LKIWFFLFLYIFSFGSHAVVKRHDVPNENYVLSEAPEYLVDMPDEGHGVLIKPQWIVTVAHTIFSDYTGTNLKIDSNLYKIEKVFIHPDFKKPSKSLLKGDLAPLMNFLKARSDIALIKLSNPVKCATPISLYTKANEQGKVITVFGKGATGDGITGEKLETKPLHHLNQFKNIIENTETNWLTFKFDEPPTGLPLEGIHASGDSGGASIINEQGVTYLVGLSSWQLAYGDISDFEGGLYGTVGYQVRISSYIGWISEILNGEKRI